MKDQTSHSTQAHELKRAARLWLSTVRAPTARGVSNVSERAARDLGRRTGWLPVAAPVSMLLFLVVTPDLYALWLPIACLFAVMAAAAALRIVLGRRLAVSANGDLLNIARRYQITVDLVALTWGCLVGFLLTARGIDQVTELALVAAIGLTAAGLTSLTLEQSLWRRFVLALWLPVLTMTAGIAVQQVPNAWLLLCLELVFVVFSLILGQRIVGDYIAGLLSRDELENAVSTIAAQRDELLDHQSRLDELIETTHKLSYYDQLTGIGSRRHFHERLDTNIAVSRRSGNTFAVLYLDVDGFKDINDTFGHAGGDELLKTVARRVSRLLRSSDFAARLGSDEIALLINDVGHDQEAASIIDRCLREIHLPVNLSGTTISPRASIGVALFPDDGDDALSLLKAAESAMNAAKHRTKTHFARYSPEMSIAAQQRLTIEQELRLAVAREQLVLHYQPQIEARSGAVSGVEALIRWQHPESGLVPPLDFIPIAENTGLIDRIGEWVLLTACRQGAQWIESGGTRVSMAVNISPVQLIDAGLVETVADCLEVTGFPVELLELEITESAIQTHVEARETLRRLHELGVRIAIDDFGTGYSSLASLKELPIDRVKIDRAFITDMLSSEQNAELLGSIVEIAHILGCDVVAEGVEQREHVRRLAALDCDCMQGYYFSEPVTAEALPRCAETASRRCRDIGADRAFVVNLHGPAADS